MLEIPIDKQVKHLAFLIKSIRIAVISVWGCFLTAICIILLVDLFELAYGKEQFQNTTAFDLIGVLLAGSAFVTTMGVCLSAWLIIDAAAEHKPLIADNKEDLLSSQDKISDVC